MKVMTIVSKIPWRKVAKVSGVVLLGTASVMGAMETDEKTQKVIKKIASKAATKMGEEA